MKGFCHGGMSLIRKIGDGASAVLGREFCIPCGGERSQVCHGASGNEEASAGLRITGKAAHPFDEPALDESGARRVRPAARMVVKGIGHQIAHPGIGGDRAWHAGEAAGMLYQRAGGADVFYFFKNLLRRPSCRGKIHFKRGVLRFAESRIAPGNHLLLLHIPVKGKGGIQKALHPFCCLLYVFLTVIHQNLHSGACVHLTALLRIS